jgi:acyl CoA:acetate/3-ketoacid CoA transferase beta subunit
MERDNVHAFHAVDDPFHPGNQIGLVQALHPDISLIHGLAADKHGNVIMCPPYGDNLWGAMAAKEGAIVTVERIVPTEVVRRYSHFCRLPAYFVRSVTAVPFGAHPMSVHSQSVADLDGYAEDHEFQCEARKAERTLEDLDTWTERWIYAVRNHQEYLDKVGFQRLLFLKGKAQSDSYVQEYESIKVLVDRGPMHSALEHQVAVSSRIIAAIIKEKGYNTVLAGVGTANLAAALASVALKAVNVDIDLMAELGFYGHQPRPCDPSGFNHRNIYTAKMLTDVEHVLGIFVSGAQSRCLGSLSAAQIDKYGNINSTYLSKKVMLVGSGGANDVASAAPEVVVTAAQSRLRFVDEVYYVTSPGRAVTTVVSDLGVYEKLGDDKELTLTGYHVRPGETDEDEAVHKIKEECGWDLKVAPKLHRHGEPSAEELGLMRMLDPHREFLD